MARIKIGKYLAVDSRVCGGRLIFKGTRIPVAHALEMAEAGYTPEGISKQYRGLVAPDAVREAQSLILRGFFKEEAKKAEMKPIISNSHKAPRPFGLCAREFLVPDDFDNPLPENISAEFEGR